MKKITLKNDFHNTEISVLAPEGMTAGEFWYHLQANPGSVYYQSESAARKKMLKIRRALCGYRDCMCGVVR